MKSGMRGVGYLSLAVLVCCGLSSAQTASVALSSMGNSTMDFASVGPYVASINGVSTLVISDDYIDFSRPGNKWTANVSKSSNLSHAQYDFSAGLKGYEEAAYLGSELLAAYAAGNKTEEGELSYAIWGIFDPLALTALELSNKTDWKAAESYLNGALNKSYSNFQVYTPTGSSGTEFLVVQSSVSTAEPAAPLMLGFDLCTVLGILFVVRRYAVRRSL